MSFYIDIDPVHLEKIVEVTGKFLHVESVLLTRSTNTSKRSIALLLETLKDLSRIFFGRNFEQRLRENEERQQQALENQRLMGIASQVQVFKQLLLLFDSNCNLFTKIYFYLVDFYIIQRVMLNCVSLTFN